MKTMRSDIIINAPVEQVWAVLSGFLFYKEWNPFIKEIRGNAAAGERLMVTAKLEHFPPICFCATIKTFVPPVRLGWQAVFLKGIFEASHTFEIQTLGLRTSRFIHSEEFSGLLSTPLLFLLAKRFRNGYRFMNESLKVRAETR